MKRNLWLFAVGAAVLLAAAGVAACGRIAGAAPGARASGYGYGPGMMGTSGRGMMGGYGSGMMGGRAAGGSTASGTPAGAAATPARGAVVVNMRGLRFVPGTLRVAAGTTVTFVNRDAVPHDVVNLSPDAMSAKPAFASPVIDPGRSWSYTFKRPGSYPILCTVDRHYLAGMVGLIVVGDPPATGTATAGPSQATSTMGIAKAEDTDKVVMPGGYFSPVVAVVRAGARVTWTNESGAAATVVSDPGDPAPFSLNVAKGGTAALAFAQPGIYRYYGAQQATYSAAMGDVRARAASAAYPVPMRGVIVVLAADGSLPASGAAAVDVPDSTMAFTPWALVVPAGTRVTFTNHDGDPHAVAAVPGYATAAMQPLALPGDGGTASEVLAQPGVYYYYCPLHARWDASIGQLVPLRAYGMYPFEMDGLIVVTPDK